MREVTWRCDEIYVGSNGNRYQLLKLGFALFCPSFVSFHFPFIFETKKGGMGGVTKGMGECKKKGRGLMDGCIALIEREGEREGEYLSQLISPKFSNFF